MSIMIVHPVPHDLSSFERIRKIQGYWQIETSGSTQGEDWTENKLKQKKAVYVTLPASTRKSCILLADPFISRTPNNIN